MGETTGISWTDKTWNPWQGCTKISPGCKFCYMYRDKKRYGQDPSVPVRSKTTFDAPLRWHTPARVFTCSWSDFFIEQADPWREEAWEIIRRTPHLTYQILTKRPERIAAHLPSDWGSGYPHVWLGVSVENQKYADERIPLLLASSAAVRFLSVEPQLEEIDLRLRQYLRATGSMQLNGVAVPRFQYPPVDWVICGAESGAGARPFELRWAEYLLMQCRIFGVPFFMKQVGPQPVSHVEYPGWEPLFSAPYGPPTGEYGVFLHDRKGGDPEEWPEHLRVREFPIQPSNITLRSETK